MLNYEVGAKTQLLADGRVTFNAAVFFSDIDDLQVIADAGSCSSRIVLNAAGGIDSARSSSCSRARTPAGIWDCPRPGVQAEITRDPPHRDRPADRRHSRRQPSADFA